MRPIQAIQELGCSRSQIGVLQGGRRVPGRSEGSWSYQPSWRVGWGTAGGRLGPGFLRPRRPARLSIDRLAFPTAHPSGDPRHTRGCVRRGPGGTGGHGARPSARVIGLRRGLSGQQAAGETRAPFCVG